MTAIVAALIGVVAVVAGVHIAESLRRHGDDVKRIISLSLDISINGSDIAAALGADTPFEGVVLENFKRLARDFAELQVLLLIQNDSVATNAVRDIHTMWLDAT